MLHGDLVARDNKTADVDRQLAQHAQRVEVGNQNDDRCAEHDHRRDGDTQHAHQPAVSARGAERALAVAAAHSPISAHSLRVGSGGDCTIHAKTSSRLRLIGSGICVTPATCRANMAPARQPALTNTRLNTITYTECEKISSAAQPARSSRTRPGKKPKQAVANSVRFSRASMASSFSLSACRCTTSVAA